MRAALVVVLSACSATSATPSTPRPSPTVTQPAAATNRTPLEQLEVSRDLDNTVIGAARTPTVVMSLASWCQHCRAELNVFDHVRVHVPNVRWLGINYKAHEEYDRRGSSQAIRALAHETPWLRIVPADDALFTAFGNPPKVPTIFVYDSTGKLIATFDRRERPAPDEPELEALLRDLH